MKKRTYCKTFLCLFLFSLSHNSFSQDQSLALKNYTTTSVKSTKPIVDGFIDDEAWRLVDWGGDFIQREPYEGTEPTQKTAFKILYDDKYLYVAYRCFDNEPEKIVRRLSRRDGFEGDWIEINIDSYNDKRTAFSFTISAAGVKSDEFISNNGDNWDASWNPIWYASTNVDSLGWTAEIKIPFSQIRYANKEEHIWGIQFTRRDFRNESRSVWQFIPQNDNNWVSKFGTLQGLNGVKPPKQIEIQPYLLAQTESFEKIEGNPFAKGSGSSIDFGLDGKLGVTSDLTLDFTINPDFGQVEADPSVLAIDGFQVFFQERRPFFIENRNLFDYQFGSAIIGGKFNNDNLFYSRRIGRNPHGTPNLVSGEYADIPDNTTILGAAKFSGKTKNGLGIGILETVTSKEYAEIDNRGERRREIIEPLTNYFVGRVTQDFAGGNTVIGGILTSTARDLKNTSLDFLHKNAYSAGFDFIQFWKNRTYYFALNTVISDVSGAPEAITRTQKSFEHYFQRPDASHLMVDTTASHLTGTGGILKIGRINKPWKFETGFTWRSPGLELNDIGFMANGDEMHYYLWSSYRFTDPFSIFRFLQLNSNIQSTWDFGGTNVFQGLNFSANSMLKNFWNLSTGIVYEHKDIDNNSLFGGPALRKSKAFANWWFASTDGRKVIQFNFNMVNAIAFEKTESASVRVNNFRIGTTVRPSNAFNFSLNTALDLHNRKVQNVSRQTFGGDTRYITGHIDQRTWSLTARLNYSISPNLTIQYYGQPFISRGRYKDFKYMTNTLADDFNERFNLYSEDEISFDDVNGSYFVDENEDGTVDYDFRDPNFSFMQFRSNLVARWEYTPGSELFLVWSQSNTTFGDPSENILSSITENLFERKAHNIFLIKLTYRFLP